MNRRTEHNYDSSNLAEALYRTWLTRGPFKIYTSNKLGPTKDNNIEKIKSRVHVKLYEIEHFMWFEETRKAIQKGETKTLEYSFYDHVLNNDEEKQRQIVPVILRRLEGIEESKRKKFYEIYDEPRLSQIKEPGIIDQGAIIKSDIIRIPLGKEGHLSDKLFEYSYNVITLPVTRLLNEIPLSDSVWYEFKGNEKFI